MASGLVEYAPIVVIPQQGPPGAGNPSPDAAPSSIFMGAGLIDPRVVYSPSDNTGATQALYAASLVKVAGAAPSTAATNNIAAAQAAASGTALTLVAATGAGITKMAAAAFVKGGNVTIPVGSLAIDGVPTYQVFGTNAGYASGFYLASQGLARAVSVTANAGATGGVVRIRGADIYGVPLTEDITAVASTTVNGKKAFKFIFSATPAFTDAGHTYAIGTADIFGLGLRATVFADLLAYFDSVLLAKATFTAAVATTATATTGDVRGTITPGVASDGTKRLDIAVMPTLGMMATVPVSTGMFGVAQFNA